MVQRVKHCAIDASEAIAAYQAAQPAEKGDAIYMEFKQTFCERLLSNYRILLAKAQMLRQFDLPETKARARDL